MKILLIADCKICGNKFGVLPSRIKNGRGKFCSNRCKYVDNQKRWIGNKDWKKTINTQFKNGHEGLLKEHSLKYWRNIYIKWRKTILERDNNKCQICGISANIIHHIKDRKNYPELLMANDNVITLCRSCHIKIHKNNA